MAQWRQRLFKVTAGLGSGDKAATVELVMEGPEYIGPFGSPADDRARTAWQRDLFRAALAARWPNERITIVSLVSTARCGRPSWDR